ISTGAERMLVPVKDDGRLAIDWIGEQGLFIAIVIVLVLTKLFIFIMKSTITMKTDEGIREGVDRSCIALISSIMILIVVGIFQASISVFAEISIFELIFNIIQEPLQGLGNTLPAAIIISLLNHLLWFFGLHGTNIIGSVIEPLYLPLIE